MPWTIRPAPERVALASGVAVIAGTGAPVPKIVGR
jgi:hypothetical protein